MVSDLRCPKCGAASLSVLLAPTVPLEYQCRGVSGPGSLGLIPELGLTAVANLTNTIHFLALNFEGRGSRQ
jgi:hypothetical protein